VSPRADASIVVIAFNEESTVSDCVSALLSQRTTRTIEVVVVDDGSTDRTRQLVLQIAARDPRVRLLAHGANLGRGAARRTGQDAVDAPLIGYVDADVIVAPDWLERCAAALATNSAVSGIATPDGDCVVLARLLHPTIRVRPHTMAISGGNVLFDAHALRAVGFDDRARLGEDVRLARQMTTLGYSIETIPGLIAEHRETKSYRATMRWMWRNGVDAARLPFEFRTIRTPDLAWLGWIVVLVVLVVLTALGSVAWSFAVVGAVLCTVLVAGSHTASRFRLRPHTIRWLAASALDVPLVAAYLGGRTVGLPAAVRSVGPRHGGASGTWAA
jgi:glycosyltransferase involved in cell wall biosynthesis